ncbi:response regulator [Gramella sp. MAR_2010_147]|uniref:response regulator n=1 Tax=Gramella sp. MAR_2010_147 TaxID=1250205 RepID=UPI00087A7553|nr:response regulator [Gramella sp. MAR_2010_147]SDR73370.1 Response regulator receiver domain-containing protein [Gramella sp. MAR_2010_147]
MRKVDIACIIDDDPIFVFGTKKIMKLANFCDNFMVFHNGEDAIKHLEPIIKSNQPSLPDVILLDLNMPIMDGWQFLDEFTAIPCTKEIIIYIVTSSIDPHDVAKASEYDKVSNYLIKPISSQKLQELLVEAE